MGITHIWVTRAHCSGCGDYLWTNPGSGSIACSCDGAFIDDDVVVTGDGVTDDAIFKTAVAADLNVAEEDLTLVKD